MGVEPVGAATSGNGAAATPSSFATTFPSGWVQDDVAVLTGHIGATSLTMATPTGWTLIPGITWPVNEGTNSRLYAWYRPLVTGDTAPTITNSGATTGGWEMRAFRGADTTNPIGQKNTSAAAAVTSLNLPTLTGCKAGSALYVGCHGRVASGTIPTNITPHANYTEGADHATSRSTAGQNLRMSNAHRLLTADGTYGGEAFTIDISSSMIAVLVELLEARRRPARATSYRPTPARATYA